MNSKPNTTADELRAQLDALMRRAFCDGPLESLEDIASARHQLKERLANAFRTGQLVHVDEVAAKLSAYADEVEEYHSAGASYVRKAAKMFAQGEPNDGYLVEQVARALAESAGAQWPQDANRYRNLARAVIPVVVEWLKEPTVEMAQAGEEALWDAGVGDLHINDVRACWKAMLAAAIRGEG